MGARVGGELVAAGHEVRWLPAAATGAVFLVVALALVPSAAGAATPSERAERYLLRAQSSDGVFGAAQGGDGAGAVQAVAALDFGQHVGEGYPLAPPG